MQVATFECQETIAEPVEASEEAIGIINELGLKGQQRLVNPATEEVAETRVPYRKIRKDELFVYQTLCPRKSSLESFSECPIPLRVLQIAAHAKGFELFKLFKVWAAEGAVKDPVLVAYESETDYWSDEKCYILARWGETLDEWGILVNRALEVWRAKYRQKLAEIKARVERELAVLDDSGIDAAMERDQPEFRGFIQ